MRSLVRERVPDDIIKRFLALLPDYVRRLASLPLCKTMPLDDFATVADDFMYANISSTILATSASRDQSAPPPPSISELFLTSLAREIADLKKTFLSTLTTMQQSCSKHSESHNDGARQSREEHSGNDKPRRSRSKQRSFSPTSTIQGLCFYHSRYGTAARHCNPPCALAKLVTVTVTSPSSENS